MKTILYVYHVATIGGGSFCLLNILKTVDRKKYKPIVLLKSNGPLVAEIRDLGIEVYFFSEMTICRYNTTLFSFSSIRHDIKLMRSKQKFEKILRQINPDIVYLNSMMFNPYLEVAKGLGFKTLIHVREHWPEKEHRWQRKKALDNIRQYADQVVAINHYSASMCTRMKHPVTIVYDWVDMDSRFVNMPLTDLMKQDVSEKKVFLFTGGLQIVKGTKDVIQMFCNNMKDPDYRLLVLGIDPNKKDGGVKMKIKQLLGILGLNTYSSRVYSLIKSDPRIVCVPSTYNLTHILKQVYCVLSFFKIPHANLALAESVICNTLMIAAKTDESEEYSYNGELALLYEINNKKEFLHAVDNLPSVYKEMKQKLSINSNYIKELFDPITNSDRLNSVYDRL